MNIEIAQNPHYEISINTHLNRVYFKIIGSWTSETDLSNYRSDWETAIGQLQPNFTILSDIRLFQPHAREIETLHEETQRYLVGKGLLVTAELISFNDIGDFQASRIVSRSKMPNAKFKNKEAAESFLNDCVLKQEQDQQA